MVTAGILPFRENSQGNRIRDLMISRQRLWPLDHEAGRISMFDKTHLTGVHLFDQHVSVIIYESLATMFPSKMITAISPNNNSYIYLFPVS